MPSQYPLEVLLLVLVVDVLVLVVDVLVLVLDVLVLVLDVLLDDEPPTPVPRSSS